MATTTFGRNRRVFVEVPCTERNVSLDPLLPNQQYTLQVSSLSPAGLRKSSEVIRFLSPSNESYNQLYVPTYPRKTRGKFRHLQSQYPYSQFETEIELPFIKLDEAVIVVFVLCFWFVVILVFCHKWGAIRHLEPYHPDFHKRESTDTEVIVDPFSSFSAAHYNPKLQSRVNTLNNANNSGSASNFASLETNPGMNAEKTSYPTRRTSSMSCVNEMHKLDHKRTVSHSSSRFNYHSFAPRLYHCASTGVCYQKRPSRDHRPSLAPDLRHPYSQTNSCVPRSSRPSFSVSSYSYSPSRRQSSFQPPASYSGMRFCPTEARITSSPTSKASSPIRDMPGRHHSLHNSLLPLPRDFQLSSHRKIKSAGDLVLELTIASRRERASREQIAESFQ